MVLDRLAVIDGKMDLLCDLLFSCRARLAGPFAVILHVAVAMFYPVFEHDLHLPQVVSALTVLMAVGMAVMLVVVVHFAPFE